MNSPLSFFLFSLLSSFPFPFSFSLFFFCIIAPPAPKICPRSTRRLRFKNIFGTLDLGRNLGRRHIYALRLSKALPTPPKAMPMRPMLPHIPLTHLLEFSVPPSTPLLSALTPSPPRCVVVPAKGRRTYGYHIGASSSQSLMTNISHPLRSRRLGRQGLRYSGGSSTSSSPRRAIRHARPADTTLSHSSHAPGLLAQLSANCEIRALQLLLKKPSLSPIHRICCVLLRRNFTR